MSFPSLASKASIPLFLFIGIFSPGDWWVEEVADTVRAAACFILTAGNSSMNRPFSFSLFFDRYKCEWRCLLYLRRGHQGESTWAAFQCTYTTRCFIKKFWKKRDAKKSLSFWVMILEAYSCFITHSVWRQTEDWMIDVKYTFLSSSSPLLNRRMVAHGLSAAVHLSWMQVACWLSPSWLFLVLPMRCTAYASLHAALQPLVRSLLRVNSVART